MANEKPLYTLYKGLKANNYDVPESYDSFERTLTSGGQGGSKHASESRHILYNALKAQNFDVPDTYESFYSTLFEPINTTTSRAKGGYASGGHGAASVHVGQSGAPTRAAASSPALPKPLPSGFGRLSIPSSPMPYVDEARRERAKVQGEGALRSWRQRVKSAQDTKDLEPTQAEQRAIDSARAAKKEEQTQQHPYSGAVGMLHEAQQGDTQAQKALADAARPALQQRKDALDYADATGGKMLRNPVEIGMTLDHEGNVVGAPMYAPTVARDEKGDMILGDDGKPLVGMTSEQAARNTYKSGMEDAVEAEKRRRAEDINRHLEDAYRTRDELDEQLKNRREELEKKPWWGKALEDMGKAAHSDLDPMATADDPEHQGFENDEEYMQLMSAARKNHQMIQTLEDKRDGKMDNFWHALGTTAMNGYTFADGLPEMRDATALEYAKKHIKAINEKRQKGLPLTREEQVAEAVLQANYANDAVQSKYGDDYGKWSRAGAMMANSIDYMKDFLLMPGAEGTAKAIAGKIASVAGKVLVKEAGESALKAFPKAIARATLKATGVLVGAHTAGAVISNTTGMGRTAALMAQKASGNVTKDEKGNYKIENEEGLMHALASAEREQMRENGSEMVGGFLGGKAFGGLAKKGLEKIGLSKVSNFLTQMGSKDWYKKYSQFLKTGGYNGIPGEAFEEYEGQLFDALTGHAGDAWNDFTSAKQNTDNWLGPLTIGALMGAIPMSIHISGYYKFRHDMNKADKVAAYRMTKDKWAPLKEELDNTDNGHMADVVAKRILMNNELSAPEKKAALGYVRGLTKFRAFNIAQVSNAGDEESQKSQEQNDAYRTGYNAVDGAADEHGIKVAYEQARDGVAGMYGEQFADQLDEDPVSTIETLEDGSKGQALASEYLRAKVAYEGMIQRAQDDMEDHVQEVTQQVERRVNTTEQGGDGMIHRATLKQKNADGTEHHVYVVNGTVQMTADGKMVDKTRSSASVVVYDPDTGKMEMVSPESIFTVDEAVDPTEELQVAVDAARNQFAEMRADQIDGFVPKQNPQQNDEVTVKGDDGQAVRGVVTEVDPLSGMYMVQTAEAVNGKKMQPFAVGQLYEATGEKMDETGSVSQKEDGYRHGMAENGTEGQAEDIPTESETEPGDSEEEATTGTTVEQEGEATEAGPGNIQTVTDGDREGNTENASAMEKIPVAKDAAGNDVVDKKTGMPVYRWHEASVGDTAEALAELNEGSLINARDTAQDMERVTNERLTNLRKRKAVGGDPISISRSRQQNRLEVEDAEKELAHWRSVKDEINRRMTAATAQRLQAEEAAKSEEQKAAEAEAKRKAQEAYDKREREQIAAAIKTENVKRNKEYPPLVAARKAYADDPEAMEVLSDTEPRDLEETVSSLLKPHSMLWSDTDRGGFAVRGLKSELGLQVGDMRRFMNLIGTVESGAKSVSEVAEDIWANMPEGMQDRYTDHDVKNVILDLFGLDNSSKMLNVAAENRIAQARQVYENNLQREEEAALMAYAEAHHIRPDEVEDFKDWLEQTFPDIIIDEETLARLDEIFAEQLIEQEEYERSHGMGGRPESTGVDRGGQEGQGVVRQQGTAEPGIDTGTAEEGAKQETAEPDAGQAVSGDGVSVQEGARGVEASQAEEPTEPRPIGKGVFGNVYDQFKGKAKEAFEFLVNHRTGDLLGVFHREDIGDIDLVWGNEQGGLSHILSKYVGEGKDFETQSIAFKKIEDVLRNGELIQDGKLRYIVSDDGYRVAIRKDYNGEKKNWVVTALDYNRSKKEKGITTNPTSASHGAEGSEPAAPRNSIGKDSKVSDTKQGNDEKSLLGIAISDYLDAYARWGENIDDNSLHDEYKNARDMLVNLLEEESDESLERLVKDSPDDVVKVVMAVRRSRAEAREAIGIHARWLDERGRIERVSKKSNVGPLSFASPASDVTRPILHGVLHDGGMVVGSDGSVLMAQRLPYDVGLEGKVTDGLGNIIEGRYPNWRRVLRSGGKPLGADLDDLESWTNGVYALLKRDKVKKAEQDATLVSLRDAEGKVHFYQLGTLSRVVSGARAIGAEGLMMNAEEMLFANTEEGSVIAMPRVMPDAYAEGFAYDGGTVERQRGAELSVFGGNRGYVGYSMSKRASHAREEGRYPKTDFKKEYGIGDTSFGLLLDAGLITGGEWHHTSMFGNRTTFYGWGAPWMAEAYRENKQAIDRLARERGKDNTDRVESLMRESAAYRVYELEQARAKRDRELYARYQQETSKTIPEEYVTSSGAVVLTNGSRDTSRWNVTKDGVALTKRSGKDERNAARQELEAWLRPDMSFEEWLSRQEDETLENNTEARQLATEAVVTALGNAGVDVVMATDEQAAAMIGSDRGDVELHTPDYGGSYTYLPVEEDLPGAEKQVVDRVEFMRTGSKKISASETASPAGQDQPTVVSNADGAKVLKGLDNLVKEYENLSSYPKTFIGDAARVLGAKRHGSASEYATFETVNGRVVTIRVANHNAKVSAFDSHGEAEGISIVISPKGNSNLVDDGHAHVMEYYYDAIKLRRADGKPLVEILKSIKQVLYSGEYKDTTGLAEVQEVNADSVSNRQSHGGTVYGWTVGGKIYLTKAGMNPNTPIHEYTHLWAAAMRGRNAAGWESIKNLLKGTPVWDEVVNDENYSDIRSDEDAVASEALSRISGRENAGKMEAEAQKVIDEAKDVFAKAEAVTLLDRMRRALTAFWKWVGTELFDIREFDSIDEVTDRVLYDLVSGTDLKVDEGYDGRVELMGSKTENKRKNIATALSGKRLTDEQQAVVDSFASNSRNNRIIIVRDDGRVKLVMKQGNEEHAGVKHALYSHYGTLRGGISAEDLLLIPEILGAGSVERKADGKNVYRMEKPGVTYTVLTYKKRGQEEFGDFYTNKKTSSSYQSIANEGKNTQDSAPTGVDDGAKLPIENETAKLDRNYLDAVERGDNAEELGEYSGKDADTRYRHGDGALTDGELSYEHDPVGKMLGRSTRTARQRREFAERERERMADAVAALSKQLHIDHVEVVTDVSQLEGKQAKVKGYFSKRTGKITIVIPNHASVEDAEKTLLHEAVGHYGLRRLFGKQFDTFLDNVFQHAEPEIRREIVALAAQRGWDFRTATEEYLAGLAEDTNFEKMPATFWMKIKRLFIDMLHGLGFEGWQGPELGDNELRYLLWRSYENLKEPGRYRSILGEAADVAKQYELKVGNYEEAGHRHGMAVNGTEGDGTEAADGVADGRRHTTAANTTGVDGSKADGSKTDGTEAAEGDVENGGDEIALMHEHAEKAQSIVLTPENFIAQFGIRGEVPTPIGIVKMGENQYKKLINENRKDQLGYIRPTLERPDIILETKAPKDGADRDSKYLFIKAFINTDGTKYVHFESVTVKQGSDEVSISSHMIREAQLRKRLKTEKILWNRFENGSEFSGETQGLDNQIGNTPTNTGNGSNNPQSISAAKVGKSSGSGVNDSENVVKPGAWGKRDLLSKAEQVSNGIDADLLFRDSIEDDNNTARATYNAWADASMQIVREAWQDSMINVRNLQNAVLDQRGEKLEDWEDAYNEENRSHGSSRAESEYFGDNLYKPLLDAVTQAAKAAKVSLGDVVEYMMAKHGLERNRVFAERDAKVAWEAYRQKKEEAFAEYQAAHKKGRKTLEDFMEKSYEDFLAQKRERDYSGLTALTGVEDVQEAEAEARGIVEDMEEKAGADSIRVLWDRTNAATKWTLRKAYESGVVSKDNYEHVRDMFAYYIPLRGWDENTAADIYDYVGSGDNGNVFSPTLHTAKGRGSRADNPIAYIGSMAVSAIVEGNKNKVKQSFMRFVENHPTNLVTVSEMWYVNDGTAEAPVWREDVPDIPEDATADDVARIVREHEEAMKQKEEQGLATKKRGGLHLRVPVKKGEALEHHVEVLVNGKKYVLYINGNPRAAQALNGTRARRASARSVESNRIGRLNRWLGQAYTSLSPAFAARNATRDLTMALITTAIKEDPAYAMLFRLNVARLGGPVRMFTLMRWYNDYVSEHGLTPPEGVSRTKRYFYEFITQGSETGYTSLKEIDDYKKDMEKLYDNMNRKIYNPMRLMRGLAGGLEYANRCIEDMTRFATYMTSRERGRSIRESTSDAKNITLNFNRKGSGELGNATYRNLQIFVTPSIQSLQNVASIASHHPVKFTLYTGLVSLVGFAMPLATQLLWSVFGGDGDDDGWNAVDEYWKLPSWQRRNNLVIWIPGTRKFAMIALAQEYRVFHGFGETVMSVLSGHDGGRPWLELASQALDLLPLDVMGNGGNPLVNFAPTVVQPALQVSFNSDFTGRPLYKDTEYNKDEPAFQKAYVGTPSWLVSSSELLNDVTGGNAHRQGWLEQVPIVGNVNNPAVVDHLLKGYLGGIYTFLAQLGSVGWTLASGESPTVHDVPVANALVTAPREREQSGKVALPEWYYAIQQENQQWQNERRGFKRDYLSGDSAAKAQWERLEGDSRQQVISRLIREVQSIRTALQYTPEEDEAQRRALEARLDEVLERLRAEHVK